MSKKVDHGKIVGVRIKKTPMAKLNKIGKQLKKQGLTSGSPSESIRFLIDKFDLKTGGVNASSNIKKG